MIVGLHTRLRPGAERAYELAHARIPNALARDMVLNGVESWRIWRVGIDLFHCIEVDDYERFSEAMRHSEANLAWQRQLAPLLDRDSPNAGQVTEVWSLLEQANHDLS